MRDWQQFVREQLNGLALDSPDKEEVQSEIAAHLEESYEGFCRRGLPEKEAAGRTLEQVSDWQQLQRKILAAKRSERPMKNRMHQLWIPGFVALILSMLILAALQEQGIQPHRSSGILLYTPWLWSLPCLGTLGAYLSRRAGGSGTRMLLASVFPVLALTVAFLLMFPIGWIAQRIINNKDVDFGFVAAGILRDGIGWILVPGAALLAGGLLVALPVQVFSSRRVKSTRVAS